MSTRDVCKRTRRLAAVKPWFLDRWVVLAWLVGSRVLVIGVAVTTQAVGHGSNLLDGGDTLAQPFRILTSWDGRWYQQAAAQGYLLVPGQQSDPAFFPFYPLLLRLLHQVGASFAAAGVILSNLLFVAAVLLLHQLGRELLPREQAERAAVYLAVAPVGFVFSMVYPESLVLVAVLGAALLAHRGRWGAAAVLAAAGALTRPEGIFVFLPLVAIARRSWGASTDRQRVLSIAAVVAAPASLLAYPAYLAWALHDPFAWTQAEDAWGRRFHAGGVYDALAHFGSQAAIHPWYARDLVFLIAYLLLIAVGLRSRLSRSWVAAAALAAVLPLATGSVESDARFGLVAPAFYWALARVATRRWLDLTLRAAFPILLAWWTFALPAANP
jgi:hypothetical protein